MNWVLTSCRACSRSTKRASSLCARSIAAFAAILICGASVFTSCTASDNPAQPAEPDLNVAEKIIGKWITAESDGETMPTNEKVVLDFVSTTEAYVSLSIQDRTAEDTPWRDREEIDVEINGNDVILFHSPKPGMNVTVDLHVESITDATLIAKRIVTIRQDGGLVRSTENIIRYEKLNVDYRNAICGMWEGMSTGAEGSEFDDGENHRWEYLTDGTFNFFRKVDGQWQISDDEYADYFVAGNLLCTRWKNAGAGNEEHREWWEIESIENGVMKWKALRQKEDGTTYTATFEMKKVDVPTQAEVEQFILGKWMISEIDGEDAVTNLKTVYDFESLTKVYMSASLNSQPEMQSFWKEKFELTAVIDDNHIALAGQKDDKTAVLDEFIVSYITADVMQCVLLHSEINEAGEMTTAPYMFCTFKKVDKDFSQTILGTWEGQATSDEGTYGDGKQHRWEYKADGTFVYYVKDGDDWVPSTNTLNEYFVAGNLLCTRWIDNEIEYREWWEIESIENDVMKWKALRQKEDGTTFTSTFEMKKVTE
jgi:hypothetical protein